MFRKITGYAFLTVVLAGVSAPGLGQELSATEILAKMDHALAGYEDQEMEVEMTVHDVDGSQKVYTFNLKQKGNSKRLVRFKSGEKKGLSVLTESAHRMYVYLPGYKKVRRVATHSLNQSFVGSAFSNSAMGVTSYSELYVPTLKSQDDKVWTLELTPKAEVDTGYARLVLQVDKETLNQGTTDYYSDSGELVKKFRTWDFTEYPGGIRRARFIEMSDPRTGHRTVMEVKKFKTNQGFKDSMFSTRQLRWSR